MIAAATKRSDALFVTEDGAYATIEGLLRCRLLAQRLSLSKQRKLLSSQAGLHTSRFRGRGIDFAEVRAYQPGDDIRSIDWRVTARTGKAHTKLYSEERERPVIILTDHRQSMFFGSRKMFKSVAAAHCTALLAWASIDRGDRVGGMVFSDHTHKEVRARRSPQRVLQLLEQLIDLNRALNSTNRSETGMALADLLKSLRQTTKPGSELFIISDFYDFDEECEHQLFQLARHNDPVCISVRDRLEHLLPPPGFYNITNGFEQDNLNLADPKLRADWEARQHAHQQAFRTRLAQLKIPLIQHSTDLNLLNTLQKGLGIPDRKGQK